MNPPGTAFWHAFIAYQADRPAIEKDDAATVEARGGGRFTYGFATLVNVLDQLLPALSKHGLALIETTHIRDGSIYLKADLVHGDSDSGISAELPVCPVGTPPQQLGSALSYIRRYLCLLLGLLAPAGEDDDGAAASKPPPRKSGKPDKPVSLRDETEPSDHERMVAAVRQARSVAQLDRLTSREDFISTLDGLGEIEAAAVRNMIGTKRAELEAHRLSQRASLLAKDPKFWAWAEAMFGISLTTEEEAKRWMYDRYGIQSLSTLDTDTVAGPMFIGDAKDFDFSRGQQQGERT